MIISTKKNIADYIEKSPSYIEAEDEYEDDEDFEGVMDELVSLIAGHRDGPEFGEDWGTWLEENFDDLLEEAISVVM